MDSLKVSMAKSKQTPKWMLRKLSKDEDEHVKAGIAQNPSTPEDVLEEYVENKHKSWAVIEGLVTNPSIPIKSLQKLSLDIIRYVIENNAVDSPFVLKLIRIAKERGLEFSIVDDSAQNFTTPHEDILRKKQIEEIQNLIEQDKKLDGQIKQLKQQENGEVSK